MCVIGVWGVWVCTVLVCGCVGVLVCTAKQWNPSNDTNKAGKVL